MGDAVHYDPLTVVAVMLGIMVVCLISLVAGFAIFWY